MYDIIYRSHHGDQEYGFTRNRVTTTPVTLSWCPGRSALHHLAQTVAVGEISPRPWYRRSPKGHTPRRGNKTICRCELTTSIFDDTWWDHSKQSDPPLRSL